MHECVPACVCLCVCVSVCIKAVVTTQVLTNTKWEYRPSIAKSDFSKKKKKLEIGSIYIKPSNFSSIFN